MAYRGGGDIGAALALGQLGTGLLAAPRLIANQQAANAQDRLLLAQMGLSPEQIEQLAPTPSVQLPGGTFGKILAGVGDVGAMLNTILGGRIPAPRPEIGTIAAVGKYLEDKGAKTRQREALDEAAELFQTPLAQALARAGRPEAAVRAEQPEGPKGSGELAEYIRHFMDQGLSLVEARREALAEIERLRAERAFASGRGGALGRFSVTSDPAYIEAEAERAQRVAEAGTRGRVGVELDPDVVEQRAEAAGIRSERVAEGRRAGERRQSLDAVLRMLDNLEGAVDRRLTAGSFLERMKQGGMLFAFKQSPEVVGRMMGLDETQIQELADDIALIETPEAFAGQVLKATGTDAGQLSNQDIARIARRFATGFESRQMAKAKIGVLRGLIRDLARMPRGESLEASLAADRALEQLDAINRGGRGRAITGQTTTTTSTTLPPAPSPGRVDLGDGFTLEIR